MAEAIFSGLITAGAVPPGDICLSDISRRRLDDLAARLGVLTELNDPANNQGAAAMAAKCDIVFIAVKPQYALPVLEALGAAVTPGQLVISIVGGLPLARIEEFISAPVVRVMPNIAMSVLAGAAGISAGSRCSGAHTDTALEIFGHLGAAFALPETLIDPLTGISGCGPAFAGIFVEALADGGVRCGLPRDLALRLAAQTLLGSAKMILDAPIHPARLKDDVCSPGGSTIAGVQALERGGFRAAVIDAVEAGVGRMAELGKKI
jgi:pyrroline-5-carboxylate reductase